MRILLDECVPWPMHKLLAGHECITAQQCGWGGIKNGELRRRAEGQFGLFQHSGSGFFKPDKPENQSRLPRK